MEKHGKQYLKRWDIQLIVSNHIIEIAQIEAERSNLRRAKVSALALDKKMRNIICKAHNTICYGTNTCYKTGAFDKFSIHAEEYLLSKLRKPIDNNMIVFVYRTKAKGAGCSRPCTKCMTLLILSGIKTICFMDKNGDYVIEKLALASDLLLNKRLL